ncbi:MAG: formate C-acetyltransferase/glycerol dehydratase family glycyl radical enzyme [Oligoflexia bacterium]|nr:formate C-acetyltransferase/glycerol dehydratase family glycyl radical enzyme [Oligoflexia bacterium]
MSNNNKESPKTCPLPPRLEKMREEYFTHKPSISIHRARAFTEVAREHWGLNPKVLKGKCIYHACETAPIYIGKHELIVGLSGGRPRAGIFSPDVSWRWLAKEIDTIDTRKVDPYELADIDRQILKNEIFPFWKGRSVDEICYKNLEELGLLSMTFESGVVDCEVKTTSGGGDLCPGYANILFKLGFSGIKRRAEERLATLRPEIPQEIDQIYFLKAVVQSCNGMMLLARRYSDAAECMSRNESDPQRKKELLEISAVLKRVPEFPPSSFREALQTVWFGQAMLYQEEITAGTSPGRVDQYIYPYFQQDLASGKITLAEAEELVYCFLFKFNENAWPLSEFASKYFTGYMPYQNLVVGGVDEKGKDATNDLTYLIMNCSKNLRMFQPTLTARIHQHSPEEYWEKIAEVISAGLGFPNVQTDEVAIKALLSLGLPLEDARNYSIMGCTEPQMAGKQVRWASATYTNFAIPFEFVLNNGVHRASGKQLGLALAEHGDHLSKLDTFEKFESAIKEQLKHILKVCGVCTLVIQKVHQQYQPKPLGSSLIEDCIERGKDYMEGGARYNTGPGIVCVGTAEYANSMYAIKKLVYDEKKVTLQELAAATASNFEGSERNRDIYKLCITASKYGNDIPAVDYFAKDIIDFAYTEIRKIPGLLAPLELSTLSVSSNVPQGEVIGALPSGRKAGKPLSDGVSPTQGTDTSGITAAIKSVDGSELWKSTDGTLYNVTINPELINTPEGRKNLVALLKGHHQLGGAQIQFNCIKRETLLDAQQHPEKYRSLMVRVAGYSAYFTELTKELQDDIISRTEQKHFS